MDSRSGETLGEYVKRIRLEKNLTVKNVSEKSGKNDAGKWNISPAYVNKIENESPNLSAPKLDALAKGLGVSRTEIYAVAYDIGFDVKAIPFERFSKIAERFSRLPKTSQDNLEPLLTAVEASIGQFEAVHFSGIDSKSDIPSVTVEEIKQRREKKPLLGEGKKK